jgi:uncharacterized protein DUF3175
MGQTRRNAKGRADALRAAAGRRRRPTATARSATAKRGRIVKRKTASKRAPPHKRATTKQYWSGKVTRESRALDLDEGVFTWHDPKRIAASLSRSAERSKARKATPFRSAMSMLVFYINRAGPNLAEQQRKVLERAKQELRHLYGKD